MPNEVPAGRRTVLVLSAALSSLGCGRQPAVAATAAAPPPPPLESGESGQSRREQRDQRQPAPSPQPADQVVARVNGRDITMRQLQQPLVEAYGLPVLLNLVQLELAKDRARELGVTVTAEDVAAERELTLAKLFPGAEKAEYETLFEQFLQNQRVTRPEFDIVLQTNAHLRKIMAPQVVGKLTDENLQQAFNEVYGETVQVRHIQAANMAEVVEAKRRVAEGEPFERVAQAVSRNPRTASLGGELPPFSRAAAQYPQAFRDAAFALKEGDVSDPVQAEGSFHLIKLERRLQPKAVKFEDVKDALRRDLEDKIVQQGMGQLRNQLGQQAVKSLTVVEPTLRDQYQRKLENRDTQIKDQDLIRQEIAKQRRQRQEEAERANAAAATQPGATTAPATAPATRPVPSTQP